jgi:lipoprotein-releasing system permease protein
MYKLILPIRYLLKRRITYFAALAVALCVFIVVVVMSVMNGLVGDFVQKNHSFAGDCVVGTDSMVGFAYYENFLAMLEKADCVEAISPVVKSYALKRREGSRLDDGVEIMGIDPLIHSRVTGFAQTLIFHENNVSNTFVIDDDPNLTGCVLGDLSLSKSAYSSETVRKNVPHIAYSISCFPLTPLGALAQAGSDIVNTKTFYFSDQSNSGLPRVDETVVYLPIEQAQILCGMNGTVKRISQIHIKFRSGVTIYNGCQIIKSLWQQFKQENAGLPLAYLLDMVNVQDWKQFRRESIGPMENEEAALVVMFAFVGLTSVFIIQVVFYMIINHKSKDIGILRSSGSSGFDIVELFLRFAFLVGFSGAALGSLAGWIFLLKINALEDWLFEHFQFQLWDRNYYAIGKIPDRLELSILVIIVLAAILACLLGAFIPTYKAARQNISDTLQVNKV